MKLVTDVKQCTHLVTNRIARTPNFLLAMALVPIIVDQGWLDACVKKGRILREHSQVRASCPPR